MSRVPQTMPRSGTGLPAPTAKKTGPHLRGGLIGANFTSALESLWSNRMRSLLTTLGVIIGVAAVIASVTLTSGASALINSRLNTLGTNSLTIYPGAPNSGGATGAVGGEQTLTQADADALVKVSHASEVSPVLSTAAQVVYGSQNWNTRVQGVYPAYQIIQGWSIAQGEWFSDRDEQAGKPVVVLGQTVASNLFDATATNPLGQTIRIRNQFFRVVGVLQSKGALGSFNQDDIVFVPFSAALTRLKNTAFVDQIQVQVDTADNVDPVQQNITVILRQRHRIANNGTSDFLIRSSNQLVQTAQQATATLTLLLVGIAGISLTVGGIGIMNIMLVSVTERTREIGIRMAIGARRQDIRNQFLIEAVTLSCLGGAIGISLGLLFGFAITSVFGLPFAPSTLSILLAFGVAAFVGITFGFYPAVRAARLDPIVALRTE